jgi:DNA-binding NarL/FixJ family response regulator
MSPSTDHKKNLPRVLIADEHTLVAEAFRNLLAPDYEVVSTVGDGRSLVRVAAELRPDLIILDVAMPILNGLDAGPQIKELLPRVKLVYMTMNPDADLAAEAFRRGASGYLVKACAAVELVSKRPSCTVLRSVHESVKWTLRQMWD